MKREDLDCFFFFLPQTVICRCDCKGSVTLGGNELTRSFSPDWPNWLVSEISMAGQVTKKHVWCSVLWIINKKCSRSILLLLHYKTTIKYSQFNFTSHIRSLNSILSPATVMLTEASKWGCIKRNSEKSPFTSMAEKAYWFIVQFRSNLS